MSVSLSVPLLRAVMPALPAERAALFLPHLFETITEFGISTPARLAAFLAQAAHESASLARLTENLNYSAKGLRSTWPQRFGSNMLAQKYARKPEAIANFVYANRLGNGTEASGDGWRYRGRGIFQLTGRANYRWAAGLLRLLLEQDPEQVATPAVGCRTAGLFWRERGCNELADAGEFIVITRKINGGVLGLEERRSYWERAKTVLQVVESAP